MNTLGDAIPGGDSNVLYTGQQTGPGVGPAGIPPNAMSQTWFNLNAAENVAVPSQSNTMLYVVLGALALLLIAGR